MSEKAILTQEQADAIEKLKDSIKENHQKFKNNHQCNLADWEYVLLDIPTEKYLNAIFEGYEVKPEVVEAPEGLVQMSKERLEKLLDDLPYSIRHSGELEPLKQFAREQAERVQELEEDCEYISHYYGLETEQNKRYREALEFYADKGTYEVVETLPPTDEYHQPIEPVFKTVPIIYYDKGKEARKALEGEE